MPKPQEAEEQLLSLYQRAVRRHLISDVPVGVLLSGGLDSALLLAVVNKVNGEAPVTFTVGFEEEFKSDEVSAARQTAKILQAPNNTVIMSRQEFEAGLPKVVAALEEPVTADSVVPMYYLCQQASQQVKVVLMGQGPDELFGGYQRHLALRYSPYWRGLPGWLRNVLAAGMQSLLPSHSLERATRAFASPQRIKRYQELFSIKSGSDITGLFHHGLVSEEDVSEKIFECWDDLRDLMRYTDELGGFQFLELRSSLPDELLMYADKLSMAHGLEVRVPYLDHEIVEYVERLSASFKVRNGSRKWLHRRVCQRFLPQQITNRKKLGFCTPAEQWFRQSVNRKLEESLVDDKSLLYTYLRRDKVLSLVQDHRNGHCNNFNLLFSLMVFEEWLRSYLN